MRIARFLITYVLLIAGPFVGERSRTVLVGRAVVSPAIMSAARNLA